MPNFPNFPDFNDLSAVIDFAADFAQRFPGATQYVVKHPSRDNYNITMQAEQAVKEGCSIVWTSSPSRN